MGWFDWLKRKPPVQDEATADELIDRLEGEGTYELIHGYFAFGTAGYEYNGLVVPKDAAARRRIQERCLELVRNYLDDPTDREELEEMLDEIEAVKLPISLELYRHRITYREESERKRVRDDIAAAVTARDVHTLVEAALDLDNVWEDLQLDDGARTQLKAEIVQTIAAMLPSPFARDYELMRYKFHELSGAPGIEPVFHALARPLREVEPEPINAELEQALTAATTDEEHREVSAVLSDWLQEREHPRGRLIALDLAGKPTEDFVVEHVEELLGPLARFPVFGGALGWRRGFVERAIVSSLDPQCVEVLELVLAQRTLVDLAIGMNSRDRALLQQLLAMITGAKPKLRALHLTNLPDEDRPMPTHDLELGSLLAALSRLRTLVVHSPGLMLDPFELPELERAAFKIEVVDQETIEALRTVALPKLRTFELLGDSTPISELLPLLESRPPLTHLGLISTGFTDECGALVERFAESLTSLDLTDGDLTDEGAALLAAMKLPALERLDVADNQLTPAGLARLRGVYRTVLG